MHNNVYVCNYRIRTCAKLSRECTGLCIQTANDYVGVQIHSVSVVLAGVNPPKVNAISHDMYSVCD